MVYPHTRILFSHKNEWSTDTNYDIVQMNLENVMQSERSHMKDHILVDSIYMKYPEEANLQRQTHRIVVA